MPSLYPVHDVSRLFLSTHAPHVKSNSDYRTKQTDSQAAQPPRFSAWSAVDDVKSKAGVLSNEAQQEISKASAAAQAKTGQIELYSAKYYAACTFGGLIACVSIR